MKHLSCIFLPLLLVGCSTLEGARTAATVADASGVPVPRPCSKTIGDEKAVTVVAKGVTVAARMSSLLARNNVPGFVKGSPSALAIYKALDDAGKGAEAAQAARLACDAKSYRDALAKAESAYAIVQSLTPGA